MYKSRSLSSFTENVNPIDPWKNKLDTIGRNKAVLYRRYKRVFLVSLIFLVITFYLVHALFLQTFSKERSETSNINFSLLEKHKLDSAFYNSTYPLTEPLYMSTGIVFRFGIITDMDTDSKSSVFQAKYSGNKFSLKFSLFKWAKRSHVLDRKNVWQSFLRLGRLSYHSRTHKVSIEWDNTDDNPINLYSSFSNGGRGMELSELIVFNGHVYSVDDRTGIIYEISGSKTIFPWVILSDGNGHEIKGFKGEWMARKGDQLYVGGLGKEWTTPNGVVLHHNPQWIKIIKPQGKVTHQNWTDIYEAMKEAAGFKSPGYIIHESAAWSDIHQSWFFLPRRASHQQYDDVADEERGTNILFQCSENFENIKVTRIGRLEDTKKGFSSFKFIPGTRDQVIVALKTFEYKDKTKSFMTAFTIDGKVILDDLLVSEAYKYEGVEFL